LRQGYLGRHVFLNGVVRTGMVHGKLRLSTNDVDLNNTTLPYYLSTSIAKILGTVLQILC
jgi:hypothetical protein